MKFVLASILLLATFFAAVPASTQEVESPATSEAATGDIMQSPGAASSTIYLSTRRSGTIQGISFDRRDILKFENGLWEKVFDGSRHGIRGNLTAFACHPAPPPDDGCDIFIYMSFNRRTRLQDIGVVQPQEVVRYEPASDGFTKILVANNVRFGRHVWADLAAGTRGSIDAIGFLPDGRLVISIRGNTPGGYPRKGDLLVANDTVERLYVGLRANRWEGLGKRENIKGVAKISSNRIPNGDFLFVAGNRSSLGEPWAILKGTPHINPSRHLVVTEYWNGKNVDFRYTIDAVDVVNGD